MKFDVKFSPHYHLFIIIKTKKGLESLHHIYTILFRREVAVARIRKVRYLGRLEHTQVGRVLRLVFWGLWARG